MTGPLACAALTVTLAGRRVLDEVSLTVEPGELVLVTGANGAGKSTLLRAFSGLVAHHGSVSLGGRDVSRTRAEARARLGIRLASGGESLFDPLTVWQSLVLAAQAAGLRGRDARAAAETAGRRFDAVDRIRDARVRALSGGERQLLALAQTLVGPTLALLADEPLRGLAPDGAEAVVELLAEARGEGKVVLVSEHLDRALVGLADRRLRLVEGRLD